VTWTIRKPITFGPVTYDRVTLRSPTGAEVLEAMKAGASNTAVVHQLIAIVSAEKVPLDVVQALPDWQLGQMADYFEDFAGNPAPDPLEQWRAARKAAAAPAPGGDPAPAS
jgi:hypothetical protein